MGIILLLFVILILALKNFQARRINFSVYQELSGNNYLKTRMDKGLYGEYKTFIALRKLPGHKVILTNLYIPRRNGSTTEIDLIMINEKGIYVFESKNFSGWIYGDETKKNWTQTFSNQKKIKFFNPIWQNNVHMNALKEVLDLHMSDFYKSYIVFSERCTLKKLYVESANVTILKRNKLLLHIKKDMLAAGNKFTVDEVNRLESTLKRYANATGETKEAHIQNIKQKQEPNEKVIAMVRRKQNKR